MLSKEIIFFYFSVYSRISFAVVMTLKGSDIESVPIFQNLYKVKLF